MELILKKYEEQTQQWPKEGKHILAQYGDEHVVVYQAYRPKIGKFAAKHGYFGGAFSYTRMSWIKTNFLWMMYRSGWGSKEGQEVVLAIYLKKAFFDELLEVAFPSSNYQGLAKDVWTQKVKQTNVRLQWDPDHDPYGTKQERRAIQLGLRNDYLLPFKGEGIVDIKDISELVAQGRECVRRKKLSELIIPKETCYPVSDSAKINLGMK